MPTGASGSLTASFPLVVKLVVDGGDMTPWETTAFKPLDAVAGFVVLLNLKGAPGGGESRGIGPPLHEFG